MRKLFFLCVMIGMLHASSIQDFANEMGYETNFKTAMIKAKAEGKDVMFFMVTQYCPWCKKYERFTLKKPEVDKQIKANYVPLIINREKKGFPEEYYVKITPVMHFIDAKNEKKILTSIGYKNKKDFLEILDKVGK